MRERVDRWAEEVTALARRWEILLIVGLSAVYFLTCWRISSSRPLWNDEIFTLYLSRYDNWAGLLGWLRMAADQQPPLFYVLTHWSLGLIGDEAQAVRVPGMVGVWAAGLGVYLFIRRWLGAVAGLCGVAMLVMARGMSYAVEARPYGLILGVYALLLVAWQRTGEGERGRKWAIGALGVLVMALGGLHYLAASGLAPLVLVELWRWWKRGRADWAVLGALALGAVPLVVHLPLLLEVRRFSTTFWSVPGLSDAVRIAWTTFTGPAVVPVLMVLIFAAAWGGLERVREGLGREGALVAGLLLMMFVLPPLIVKATGGFVGRYVVVLVTGMALAAGWGAGRVAKLGGRVMALLMAGLFLSGAVYTVWREPEGPFRPERFELSGVMAEMKGGEDQLVVDSPLRFLECWEHGNEQLRGRLRYYASAGEARRILGFDSGEQSLMRLARTVGLPVSEWGALEGGERFLLVRSRNAGNSWLPRALSEAGARMEIAEVQTGFDLIRVTMPSDWKGKQR
ncbi:MAG: glycosyltransferase family 39 protein [Solibacteraceae bacterium]|nr:glycosyltransferase family 39 protein [Solibacteraceae bacterium]